jgi:nitroimidazol reductase NimA-like FMN-containing flavoprotein (pyridoxamine 5'-phosphate oxidase superfamily)
VSDGTTGNDAGTGGTDLGRRIAEQREHAGLSRAGAAERAGMSPEYLTYLETSAEPNPSHADLMRLAAALGTTPAALAGAGLMAAPGQRGAMQNAVLEVLTAAECRAHLAPGGIGRFLFVADRGPVAVPVNYAMLGADVVFRTTDRTAAAGAISQRRVSFDVDHIDDALSEGWSVLVSGTASILTRPEEIRAAADLGIQTWPGGDRDTFIRIHPAEVTGRRIRARAPR